MSIFANSLSFPAPSSCLYGRPFSIFPSPEGGEAQQAGHPGAAYPLRRGKVTTMLCILSELLRRDKILFSIGSILIGDNGPKGLATRAADR
jgi:hypothetical protein